MDLFEPALNEKPPSLQDALRQRLADWASLPTQWPDDPAFFRQVVQVWAGSDYIAQRFARRGEALTALWQSGDLQRAYPPGHLLDSLTQQLPLAAPEEELYRTLRLFRHRELVRIAWRDLTGAAAIEETLKDQSALAAALIHRAYQLLYHRLVQRFGEPVAKGEQVLHLVILGMGKLGGEELNFSSDVDLIFAYPKGGVTRSGRLDAEGFFRRLGQSLIAALSKVTEDGFVYRVDMRLRPFGSVGPLAITFSAMEEYYQNHGRDWERYALIKARPIAGDIEAGWQLLERLRPFVYRRYIDYSVTESLREMKATILQEMAQPELQRDIKRGPGGIREVEFIVQAFQLIYGGREPALRQRQLRLALAYLGQTRRLRAEVVNALQQGYDFLRRVENRLQIWADQQTHQLPDAELQRLRLALMMGFADWPTFYAALEAVRAQISCHFSAMFAMEAGEQAPRDDQWSTLWSGEAVPHAAIDQLTKAGFQRPKEIFRALTSLREGHSTRMMSERGFRRLGRLMPALIESSSQQADPDVVLERLIQVIEAIARRSVYLSLLADNESVRGQLVKLCAASPWFSQHLGRFPILIDELIHPATLYDPLDRAGLERSLQEQLQRAEALGEEGLMDALRLFKQAQVLRIAAADIHQMLPLMRVSDGLTHLAETLLVHVLQLARRDLLKRYGEPSCLVEGVEQSAEMAIIGYGKLGGIEMSYGSDLDVVFLHNSRGEAQQTSGPKSIDNSLFFARFGQRLIHWLTTRTGSGTLYEVDTRLRPSGRGGVLVSSLQGFADYQRQQAWTWEHQALVRARYVAGSEAVRRQFEAIRADILCQPRDVAALKADVIAMRERMREHLGSKSSAMFHVKQDRGGLVDAEFIVQYLVLLYAHQHPTLVAYSDNVRQIDALVETGILSVTTGTELRESYLALRQIEHRIALQEQSKLVALEEVKEFRDRVAALWQAQFGAS